MKNIIPFMIFALLSACNTASKKEEASDKASKPSAISINSNIVDSLFKDYKKCLDEGTAMYGCTKTFYREMDSLITINHTFLLQNAGNTPLDSIQKEQKEWLVLKEKTFATIDKDSEKDKAELGGGDDFYMIVLNEKAEFLKARNVALMEKMKLMTK
jgi:hypothetical protein